MRERVFLETSLAEIGNISSFPRSQSPLWLITKWLIGNTDLIFCLGSSEIAVVVLGRRFPMLMGHTSGRTVSPLSSSLSVKVYTRNDRQATPPQSRTRTR